MVGLEGAEHKAPMCRLFVLECLPSQMMSA